MTGSLHISSLESVLIPSFCAQGINISYSGFTRQITYFRLSPMIKDWLIYTLSLIDDSIGAGATFIPVDRTRIRFLRSKIRSEEHTSELQSRGHLVCRLLLEKKKEATEDTRQPSCEQSREKTDSAATTIHPSLMS